MRLILDVSENERVILQNILKEQIETKTEILNGEDPLLMSQNRKPFQRELPQEMHDTYTFLVQSYRNMLKQIT